MTVDIMKKDDPRSADPSLGSAVELTRSQRMRHEFALAHMLEDEWAAVPIELINEVGRTSLRYKETGSTLLERVLERPLTLRRALRLGTGITFALERLHRLDLVHRDLNPAHILIGVQDRVQLTGFGIASRVVRDASNPAGNARGSVAYMSPEQTGRMNRVVDARSDLYSLGVTLYRMLTGVLPFDDADAAQCIHSHIARQPVPLDRRSDAVPHSVSNIVLRLLAKTPEDRYQTAAGVAADLDAMLQALETGEQLEPFVLGSRDVSNQLRLSERRFARGGDVAQLFSSFERMVRNRTMQVLLVSGFSGIGKTSFVGELRKVVPLERAFFAVGKYDQYKRNVPFATIALALQELIKQVLGKAPADLAKWQAILQAALGANGILMTSLIPDLALIVGAPNPVLELPASQAKDRFHTVLRRLIQVFASADHPLVLFLDDLQWVDPETLGFFERLAIDRDIDHLLLIGAYRENEVREDHPLAVSLASVREDASRLNEIALQPLLQSDVISLLSESLSTSRASIADLAALIHEKSGGNPFFVNQFVAALAEEGLISFDHTQGRWRWDIVQIETKSFTDNVIELMTARLSRLRGRALETVKVFACIGDRASVATLGSALSLSDEEVHVSMNEVAEAGLVVRHDDVYSFLHDRVQEAAYALVPPADHSVLHLRIGRAMAARLRIADPEIYIFDVVNQFNRGLMLIVDFSEREAVAELNLRAARHARVSVAYRSALGYLITASTLLSEDSWSRLHPLCFAVEFHLAECEFLTGDICSGERRLTVLASRPMTRLEEASVAWLQVTLCMAMGQLDRAISIAISHLNEKDSTSWSARPTREAVLQEYEPIRRLAAEASIEGLSELPHLVDAEARGTLDVLTALLPAAFFTNNNLILLVLCRMVNLSIDFGNTDASCMAYAYLGMAIGQAFGEYASGHRFGRLGLELANDGGLAQYKARVIMCFGYHVLPWTRPVKTGRPYIQRAFAEAKQSGDLTYAGLTCCTLVSNLICSGAPLDEIQKEAEKGLAFVKSTNFGLVVGVITTQLQFVKALRGLTTCLSSFSDDSFDEDAFEDLLEAGAEPVLTRCWYWIRKLQIFYHAGEYAEALAADRLAAPLLWTTFGHLELVDYHFYAALNRAATIEITEPVGRATHLSAILAHRQKLAEWAASCPENFLHRLQLLDAELARVEGRELDALDLYEAAGGLARQNGFLDVEALSLQLASAVYLARGLRTAARAHLFMCRDAYRRLGAEGKVSLLSHADRGLRDIVDPATRAADTGLDHIDLSTLVRSSEAIAGEAAVDKLLDTLMVIALAHAGAQRGLLVTGRGDTIWMEAEAFVEEDRTVVLLTRRNATQDDAPLSILHTAMRTKEMVLLDDAQAPNAFSEDPYFRNGQSRSVLCVPVVRQGDLKGLLFLENGLLSHVFTPARTAVLKLLASQAALSLENASLEEKDALLKEVHHRVKNNLQLVSSLLSLQASQVVDPATAEMFSESRNRVRSMALVHENLYRAGNFARISMSEHVTSLCSHLLQAYAEKGRGLKLVTAVADVQLDVDRAVSCGLIINELVSNALKHAFPNGRSGTINVSLSHMLEGSATLVVADDGIGMPADRRYGTMGLQLVEDLSEQLRGTMSLHRQNGTKFTIVFETAQRTKPRP